MSHCNAFRGIRYVLSLDPIFCCMITSFINLRKQWFECVDIYRFDTDNLLGDLFGYLYDLIDLLGAISCSSPEAHCEKLHSTIQAFRKQHWHVM